MQRLLRILALIHKELLALLKDKRSRFVLIGPPLVQLMLFGYAATFDINRVPLAVDGRNSNTALILLGYARRVATDFNQDRAARHGRPLPPAQVRARAWHNANLQSRWFIVRASWRC